MVNSQSFTLSFSPDLVYHYLVLDPHQFLCFNFLLLFVVSDRQASWISFWLVLEGSDGPRLDLLNTHFSFFDWAPIRFYLNYRKRSSFFCSNSQIDPFLIFLFLQKGRVVKMKQQSNSQSNSPSWTPPQDSGGLLLPLDCHRAVNKIHKLIYKLQK